MSELTQTPEHGASTLPATVLEKDPRYIGLRDELIRTWRETNGNEWKGNVLRTDFQDFLYGKTGARDPNLKKTIEHRMKEAFEERFPEDSALYKDAVYPKAIDDPTVAALKSEIITLTNRNPDTQTSSQKWFAENSRVTKQQWDAFVESYPQKAKAYKDEIADISEALERAGQKDSQEQGPKVSQDARDFFTDTQFQKEAASLDPDKSHHWETANANQLCIEDTTGTLAVAETYNPKEKDNSAGILLVDKPRDEQEPTLSLYIDNLSQSRRSDVLDVVHKVTARLDEKQRHKCINTLIRGLESEQVQSLSDVDFALFVSELPVLLLDANSEAEERDETDVSWYEGTGRQPTDEQEKKVNEFLTIVSTKVAKDRFEQYKEKLQEYIRFNDQIFSRDFKSLFTYLRDLVFDDPSGPIPERYNVKKRYLGADFPVTDQISEKMPVDSSAMRDRLKSMPFERAPSLSLHKFETPNAEFVDIADVVGGTNFDDWTISTSAGRGPDHVLEVAEKIKENSLSVTKPPMQLVEINGKLYIDADGRHRLAALKVLGVKRVPMMVRHANE